MKTEYTALELEILQARMKKAAPAAAELLARLDHVAPHNALRNSEMGVCFNLSEAADCECYDLIPAVTKHWKHPLNTAPGDAYPISETLDQRLAAKREASRAHMRHAEFHWRWYGAPGEARRSLLQFIANHPNLFDNMEPADEDQ